MSLTPKTIINFNTFDYKLIPDKDIISVSGERNATLFIIPIPKLFLKPDFVYHVLFETSKGHKKRSEPLTPNENGEIETYLPREFSVTGDLKIQLVVTNAEQTLKTFESPYMTIKSSILASEEVDSNDLNLLEGAILKFNEVQDKLPYIDDETDTWFVYDLSLGEYVDTGKKAVGSGGSSGGSSTPADNKFRKVGIIMREENWLATIDPEENRNFVLRAFNGDPLNTLTDEFTVWNGGTTGTPIRRSAFIDLPGVLVDEEKHIYEFNLPRGYDFDPILKITNSSYMNGAGSYGFKKQIHLPPPDIYKNVGVVFNPSGVNYQLFDYDDMSRYVFLQAKSPDQLNGFLVGRFGSWTGAPDNKFDVPFDKCWGLLRAFPGETSNYRQYLLSAKVPLYDKDGHFVDDFTVYDKDGNQLADNYALVQIPSSESHPAFYWINDIGELQYSNYPRDLYNLVNWTFDRDMLLQAITLNLDSDLTQTSAWIEMSERTAGEGRAGSDNSLNLQRHFKLTASVISPGGCIGLSLSTSPGGYSDIRVRSNMSAVNNEYIVTFEGKRITEDAWEVTGTISPKGHYRIQEDLGAIYTSVLTQYGSPINALCLYSAPYRGSTEIQSISLTPLSRDTAYEFAGLVLVGH